MARVVSLVARQISSFAEFTNILCIKSLTLVYLFEQISLVHLQHRHVSMNQPNLLPRIPCPPAPMMLAVAWWAGSEHSETMPDCGTESSRASVPPTASLCNWDRSPPPPPHITIVIWGRDEEAGWERFPPQRIKRQAPMWRWRFKPQKAFI